MPTETNASDVLSTIALFADLPPARLEEIAHTFDEQTFEDGERILRQGLGGTSFFLIVEGTAEVRAGDKQIARLARGDFFGEISILLGDPPTADVIATSPLRCLTLPGSAMQEFLLAHPSVAYRMLQAQARRLRSNLRWLS